MKKSLLALGAVVAVASAANAQQLIGDFAVQKISPDGKLMVSSIYGTMSIQYLNDDAQRTPGQSFVFEADGTGTANFSTGVGNAIGHNGTDYVVLGSTDYNTDAAYFTGGEWHQLNVGEGNTNMCMANGITPDAKRICGSIGLTGFGIADDAQMLAPAYWDVNADGTYGEYHLLPQPALDFTGRVPQYVTAVSISADGRTIWGQVVDYSGMIYDPIVYTQDAEGNWSYNLPVHHLLNPDNVEFPEWPGEFTMEQPDVKNHMTEENAAAYEVAMQAYYESGYDEALFPNAADYMTEEQIAAYNAEVDAYNAYATEYNEKISAYYDVLTPLMDAAPKFTFNSVETDGEAQKHYTTLTTLVENPDSWFGFDEITEPVLIGLDGTMTRFDNGSGKQNSNILNDGTLLACNNTLTEGYALVDGTFIPFAEYVLSKYPDSEWNQAAATFIAENATFEIEDYVGDDPETGEPILETKNWVLPGVPFASADGSLLACWCENIWDFTTVASTFYFVPTAGENSVGNVMDSSVVRTELYDLQGRRVQGNVAPGVYVQKNIKADGTATSVKVNK